MMPGPRHLFEDAEGLLSVLMLLAGLMLSMIYAMPMAISREDLEAAHEFWDQHGKGDYTLKGFFKPCAQAAACLLICTLLAASLYMSLCFSGAREDPEVLASWWKVAQFLILGLYTCFITGLILANTALLRGIACILPDTIAGDIRSWLNEEMLVPFYVIFFTGLIAIIGHNSFLQCVARKKRVVQQEAGCVETACEAQMSKLLEGLPDYSSELCTVDLTYEIILAHCDDRVFLEKVLEKAGVSSLGHRLEIIRRLRADAAARPCEQAQMDGTIELVQEERAMAMAVCASPTPVPSCLGRD